MGSYCVEQGAVGEVGEELFWFGLRPEDPHRRVSTDGPHLLQRLGEAEQGGANLKVHGARGEGKGMPHRTWGGGDSIGCFGHARAPACRSDQLF